MTTRNVTIISLILMTFNCKGQQLKYDTIVKYGNYTAEMKTNNIPDSIFQMENLKSLSIIGMECDVLILDDKGNDITECWVIREVPLNINKLKKLEYLNLSLNAIKVIPREISDLSHLKVLDLTDNTALENIDNIALLSNLEELYLFGCNLAKLPSDFFKLKKLKKLGLTGNGLDESEIKRLKIELPNCEIIY